MGLFKLTTSSKSGIPTAIEFDQKDSEFMDSDTRMTGDDDEYYDEMMGRGINTRGGGRVDPMSTTFRNPGMVGRGVNSRRLQQQMPSQYATNDGNSRDKNSTGGSTKKNPDSDEEGANNINRPRSKGLDGSDKRSIDDIMQDCEEKMKNWDQTKFMEFGDSDDDNSKSMLSGIEEENNRRGGAKGKKLSSFSAKTGGKSSAATDQKYNYHRPAIDSDYDSESDGDEDGSYISGEYDEEFDNAQGHAAVGTASPNAPIGVPNGKGSQLTHRQLEDELYLYKLETLNLTDACRELAEQLDEAERKLESVQAQATFRIHALEAELQDGHVGMKSLVKMTSTEMDGRLEALRALGKTASIQAEKIKERDMELNRMDGKLRKTLRDIKSFKRENKKIKDEKVYLKQRLEDLEQVRDGLEGSLAKLTAEAHNNSRELSQKELEKMKAIKSKLNDTLEQVGYLKSQIEHKDEELEELRERCAQKEAEIEQVRDDLALKENDVVRVELQLERVRKDLFEAAAAAKIAEEARVEAQSKEAAVREELEEALGALEEVSTRVAMLESNEAEMKRQVEEKSPSEQDVKAFEEQKTKLHEMENEVSRLKEEKDEAVRAVDAAKVSYESIIAERQREIETLNKDVEVHDEQIILAQSMLDEKESLVMDLRAQLDDVKSEYAITRSQLEEDLATKSREVLNIKIELEESTNDVSRLEEMLTKLRAEISEQQSKAEAREGEEQVVTAAAVPSSAANVAEMETKIDRLERELGTYKRQIEAANVELQEKDRTTDRIKADMEKLRQDKNARVEELEYSVEEKSKTLVNYRRELDESKLVSEQLEKQLSSAQLELSEAMEAVDRAEAAQQQALKSIEESKVSEQAANHACEKLKTQVELLQKAKEDLHSELVVLRIEHSRDQQSSTQAAAALAATNAARQAEMEMQIESMQKEIDTKKREIDTIKTQLQERDASTAQLKSEMHDLRNEMVHYKEKVESEEEQRQVQLKAIANKEYFEEDEKSMVSMNSSTGLGSSSRLGLFSRFSRSKAHDSDFSWDAAEGLDKDARIEQLEKSVSENVLIIANLRNELVSASSKFNKDESQRRMLIQRLENENQAYSIKLEVLENEFNQLKKKRSNFDSSIEQMKNKSIGEQFGQSFFTAASDNSYDEYGSTSSMSGVSAISGASKLTPMERDVKKLRKQKKLYENRISSLQTQLSEIQQIVPELMSKSKSQIAKLEATVQSQKEEAEAKQKALNDEISDLKQQNEQLQAATRSRLQASDIERQDEIEQLKMRLEAREATIAKLEALASTKAPSSKKKGGKLLRKKKSKNADGNSVMSGMASIEELE